MRTDTPPTIYRKDYAAPSYLVDTVDMGFDLMPARTLVATRIVMRRNPASSEQDIVLYGEEIELLQLRLNGKTLHARDYRLDGGILRIPRAPHERHAGNRNRAAAGSQYFADGTVRFQRQFSLPNAKPKASAKSPISLIARM